MKILPFDESVILVLSAVLKSFKNLNAEAIEQRRNEVLVLSNLILQTRISNGTGRLSGLIKSLRELEREYQDVLKKNTIIRYELHFLAGQLEARLFSHSH